MSDQGYGIARLDELDRVMLADGILWRPVRRRFGIGAFGVNAWTAKEPGDQVLEKHREVDGPEELYVVLTGRATFTLGEDEHDAPAGTIVFVRPGTFRGAVAAEPDTTVLAVGAKQGEVFAPSPWEETYLAFGHYRDGDEAEARRILREAVANRPDAWQAHFNLACLESLTGNRDAALDALARAVELEPETVRRAAAADEDFDAIGDDPRFREIVS